MAFGNGDGMIPLGKNDAMRHQLALNNIAEGGDTYKPEPHTIYKIVKKSAIGTYGCNVHTAYIAEVKHRLSLPMRNQQSHQ